MDVFQNALVFIAVHRSVWQDANVTNAREGIYWMSINDRQDSRRRLEPERRRGAESSWRKPQAGRTA